MRLPVNRNLSISATQLEARSKNEVSRRHDVNLWIPSTIRRPLTDRTY